MFLCTSFCKLIVWHTATGVLKSPCIAHQADQMGFTLCKFTRLGYGIHLIPTASIIKRLSLYEFTLWGQDLESVVRIRESPYYRGSFLKKIYENFVGTLETVRNIQRCLYQRGVCTERFDCSLVGEREIHLWCVYVLHKVFTDI